MINAQINYRQHRTLYDRFDYPKERSYEMFGFSRDAWNATEQGRARNRRSEFEVQSR